MIPDILEATVCQTQTYTITRNSLTRRDCGGGDDEPSRDETRLDDATRRRDDETRRDETKGSPIRRIWLADWLAQL